MTPADPDILIALGANLPGAADAAPVATLEAALDEIGRRGIEILARSSWWESAPVPASDQPWYVNGVAAIRTRLDPVGLLAALHAIEAGFGRRRAVRNEARVLDLDLIAYGAIVRRGPEPPILPHPRVAGRAFVLLPLEEIRPEWRHPESGIGLRQLIARLPAGQICRPLAKS